LPDFLNKDSEQALAGYVYKTALWSAFNQAKRNRRVTSLDKAEQDSTSRSEDLPPLADRIKDETIDEDDIRDKYLSDLGIEVIRYASLEVLNELEGILENLEIIIENKKG